MTLPIANYTYIFARGADCFGRPITMTWSVDKYATIPTFMSMSNNNTHGFLSLNPTSSDVGTYTVAIRESLDADNT